MWRRSWGGRGEVIVVTKEEVMETNVMNQEWMDFI